MEKNKMIFASSNPIKPSDEISEGFKRRLHKLNLSKPYNVLVFYDGPRLNEFKEFETYEEAIEFANSTGKFCLISMALEEVNRRNL